MPIEAPKIDRRSYQQLVERAEQLASLYAGWQPDPGGRPDGGQALIRIFARMAELLISRLNRVPEKHFLAFLDLIGTQILPPQPARVPLTFRLAAGSTGDALVPAGTQVAAAPAPGDAEPVIFETERDLVVTRSELAAVFYREPGRDRYGGDFAAAATGEAAATFPTFGSDDPAEHAATDHRLYLAHPAFTVAASRRDITLRFAPAEGEVAWLSAVVWEYWDGSSYTPLDPKSITAPRVAGGAWQITLRGVPPLVPAGPNTRASAGPASGGRVGAWLRGSLTTPLPRNAEVERLAAAASPRPWRPNLQPDAAFSDSTPLELSQVWFPFGEDTRRTTLYLASDEAFGAAGAPLTIAFALDPAQPAQPSGDLVLAWEYWNGTTWQELGRSTPLGTATAPGPYGFADATCALRRDGSVSFVCPDSWAPRQVDQEPQERRWLRARIVAGGYSTRVGGYRPPAVQRTVLSYGALPRIQTIQTQVRALDSSLAPEQGFANQTELDLSKDFFPFGEKPRFNDTLYLAHDVAFSKPGAQITLAVTLTNRDDEGREPLPARPEKVELAWEYWDGTRGAWLPLEVDDKTESLAFSSAEEAEVSFRAPATIGATTVNGVARHWIRVRLAQGSYGREASYTELRDAAGRLIGVDGRPTEVPVYRLVPASFRPPSIRSIRISYDYTSALAPPDAALSENDFVVEDLTALVKAPGAAPGGRPAFQPFKPMQSDTHPALYLGFRRPGSATGFANRATSLYVSVYEVPYSELALEGRARDEPASVVWEYWDGARWRRLGTRDETGGFTRRGLVTFVGPLDFRARSDFGTAEALFWLRAVWERGAYGQLPRLRRVVTNTIWAANTLSVSNEVLGSGTGEPGQTLQTTRAPVLPGQVLEVRELEEPSADERAAIEAEEGADAVRSVPGAAGQPPEIWTRWHETTDFYGSGPRSRHYTLDRLTGTLRFGDGRHGLAPPPGRGNIRLAAYQTGGGPAGNRASHSITQLKTTVPFVDSVTNPEPALGGTPAETPEAALDRGPRTLRHRDRAVTIADYEDLARQASPDVALVRVIATSDAQSAGAIALIIVAHSGALQPIPSLELLARVQAYLAERHAPTVDIVVGGPDWLKVSVAAEIVPLVPEAATDVQTAVLARLAAFLHPLTGGLDGAGWAFGRKPYRSDLFALVERTPGVSHVRSLQVDEQPDPGGARPDRFLVYSGEHRIVMASIVDQADL